MLDIYTNRLNLLDQNLRNCNGGNEIHEVSNMRHQITLIRELLKTEIDEVIHKMMNQLETKQVEFFKRKFSHLNKI